MINLLIDSSKVYCNHEIWVHLGVILVKNKAFILCHFCQLDFSKHGFMNNMIVFGYKLQSSSDSVFSEVLHNKNLIFGRTYQVLI